MCGYGCSKMIMDGTSFGPGPEEVPSRGRSLPLIEALHYHDTVLPVRLCRGLAGWRQLSQCGALAEATKLAKFGRRAALVSTGCRSELGQATSLTFTHAPPNPGPNRGRELQPPPPFA